MDVPLVQPIQVGVGGQLRVEHQLGRMLPGLLVPELDEPQDLVGLLGLGYAGVGVAEDAVAGIAGQEGQDALLAAAASGDVVLLQRFFLGIGGDGVEIQVERRASWQAGPMDLVQPSLQQAETHRGDRRGSCRRPDRSAWGPR